MLTSEMDMAMRARMQALDNRRLRLILLPTEKCNFRCTYCYESFELGQMPQRVIEGIKQLLTHRTKELNKLEIDWFGGEPLLAFNIVKDINAHAMQLMQHNACSFLSSMTTNAYLLTPERLEQLVELGVTRYQITLDGFDGTHDETRKRKNGRGSFAVIWKNLMEAKKTALKFRIMLRVHFSPTNLSRLPLLIDQIKENFCGDPRFEVFFKAISHLGGANDEHTPRFRSSSAKKYQKLLADYLGKGVKSTVIKPQMLYVCYASEPNSLVIRSNGKLAKCTVAFNDERNEVGEISQDGSLSFNHERLHLWFKGLQNLDKQDLGCPHSRMEQRAAYRSLEVRFQSRG